jgi:anti-sigma B factor antagonist
MDINVSVDGTTAQIKVSGIIDNDNAEELKQQLSSVQDRSVKDATLDLSLVPSITSSGIGKLLVFYKALDSKGGKITIDGIHSNLLKLFKSIKLDKLFDIKE